MLYKESEKFTNSRQRARHKGKALHEGKTQRQSIAWGGSEKKGWEAGPVRVEEVLEEVDGAGQALEQRERTVRHAGKVAMHVHAPVTKLDSPAKKIWRNKYLTVPGLSSQKNIKKSAAVKGPGSGSFFHFLFL